jgi:hypothetical protein
VQDTSESPKESKNGGEVVAMDLELSSNDTAEIAVSSK